MSLYKGPLGLIFPLLMAAGLRRCNGCTRRVRSGGLEAKALGDLLGGTRGADCRTVGKGARSELIAEDRE